MARRPSHEGGHPVLDFYGEIISRWPNLYQWWLTPPALQGRTLKELLEEADQSPT